MSQHEPWTARQLAFFMLCNLAATCSFFYIVILITQKNKQPGPGTGPT